MRVFLFLFYCFFIYATPPEREEGAPQSPPPQRVIPLRTPKGLRAAQKRYLSRNKNTKRLLSFPLTPKSRAALANEKSVLGRVTAYVRENKENIYDMVMNRESTKSPLNPKTMLKHFTHYLSADKQTHFVERRFGKPPTLVWTAPNLINPARMDDQGRTNLDRMKEGIAPIGPDGLSVQLHHVTQTNDGPLMELSATAHRDHSFGLHYRHAARFVQYKEPDALKSLMTPIDRSAFAAKRQALWKAQAEEWTNLGLSPLEADT